MRRRLAFTNLVIAFFASNIIAFGVPKRNLLRFAPNEIIVKFENDSTATLEETTSAGSNAAQFELSKQSDNISSRQAEKRKVTPEFTLFLIKLNCLPSLCIMEI